MVLWLAMAASACDGPERKLVGWTPNGDQALIRLECQYCTTPIELRLLALPAGTLVKEWVILKEGESEAVRGERWKAAEAELVAMGVKIDPALKPVDGPWSGPWAFGSWKVSVLREKIDNYDVRYTLVVADGTKEVRVREIARGGNAANDPNFANAFLSPDGQTLLLQDIASCGQRDELAVTAAAVRAALQ